MTHRTRMFDCRLTCDQDGEGFVATQTAPDLFYHHLIDLKGRPSEGVPDAHMLFRCPHTADGIAALAIFPRNANKMKVGFGGSWGWQLGKWRGLKVGSNLPISQLGVLKCLARGQTGGSEQAARNIIIKQCIVKCNLCNWTFLCKFSPNISFSNLTKYILGRYIEQIPSRRLLDFQGFQSYMEMLTNGDDAFRLNCLENKTSAAPTCNIRKEEVFVCRGEASAVPFVAPAIWIDAPLCAPWMP